MKQPRPLKRGNHGLDVKAMKRALKKAGFHHGTGTRGRFGLKMEHAVKHFQEANELEVTGRIGHPTFVQLEPFIDPFGRMLLITYRARRRKVLRAEHAERIRALMKNEMDWGLAHEAKIHYPKNDIRLEPNNVPIDRWFEHRVPVTLDCSQAATAVAKAAGAPDPTDSGWGHHGLLFTGSMLRTCKQIPEHALEVGDYVVFGPSTGDHVSVVYQTGLDPMMWSHGFEGGPLLIRLSEQKTQHRSPARCLASGA